MPTRLRIDPEQELGPADRSDATGPCGRAAQGDLRVNLVSAAGGAPGEKWAILTVAHAIVVSAFQMLFHHESYHEFGATYVDEHHRERLIDW
jgi:hypothetical protein